MPDSDVSARSYDDAFERTSKNVRSVYVVGLGFLPLFHPYRLVAIRRTEQLRPHVRSAR